MHFKTNVIANAYSVHLHEVSQYEPLVLEKAFHAVISCPSSQCSDWIITR